MFTAVVQIGNSDDKLAQAEWADFARHMDSVINQNVSQVHFSGGSDWNAPWQNACWVCEVDEDQMGPLVEAVRMCRRQWRQEAAAITWGHTKDA